MTAAVLTHKGITNPFLYINNRERTTTNAVSTASARSTTHNTSMTNGAMSPAESSTGAFGRMRSTIEQSLRNATRSKKSPSPDADEFATITARPSKGKGKEREVPVPVPKLKESSKSNNLLSKVTFGRAGRESLSPSPIPPAPVKKDASDVVRQAGFTSYMTPSLRGGSMSSPSLPLSSQQPTNTHKSRPPIPAPSSSAADGLARAPSRDRQGRSSMQPSQREISTPVPLGTRRETPAHQSKSSSSSKPTTRHRSTQSVPLVLSHQLPSSPVGKVETARSPEPSRSRRKDAELPSPPSSPTPPSPTRSNTFYASRRVAASSGHLPLNNSPLAPRATSPGRTRPSRVITPTQREIRSPTPSNLPSPPSTPTSARRPSIESPHRSALEKARRPSMDAPRPSIESTRRPSVGSPRRPSIEAPRRPSIEVARQESPSPRPRPVSPNQRSYAQNRHFNMSTASLTGPPNPEYRELIRTATSMLCKELIKKPMHLSKNEAGAKDWAEVEERMNALRRAERMWSKSAVAPASPTSSGFNSAEERERRLFWETLRDGFVLCHLLNKMRSGFVVKPDPREERVTRLSNVNKFLAACASHGLPDSDTFNPDDLTEGTGECLARVAKTIIALVRHVETPMNEKPTFITATEEAKRPAPIAIPPRRHRIDSPPRGSPGLAPRTSLSVSPGRRRYSPPSGLPPVYAHEDVFIEDSGDETEGPFSSPSVILTPPPKSPLRARAARRNSENKYPLGSSPSPMSTSVPNSSSLHESFAMRQSVASSALTESTATTDISSILDFGRSRTYSNGHSKFGTIRTMTTDVTSEAPSMSRTEGSAIADELARKWYPLPETPTKHRDIKLSDAAEVMRVVEEGDESVSSSRSGGKNRERAAADRDQPTPSRPDKHNAIHLRKGKWPDDFMDVFRGQSPPSNLDPDLLAYLDDQESTSSVISTSSAISASPPSRSPRKLAIVEGNQRNDGKDPLPRRPTHRARQTADAPILLPKEALQFRDSSPDPSMASSGRVLLRRHSTKPNVASRSAVALPPQLDDTDELSGQTHVPFPRTTSGEYLNAEIGHHERPRLHRGRFQSDIDSSSARRRTRPTSIDGLRPDRRSRIESMGHLGSKNESASDLLASPRDSVDGSAVRKTLVVREDGKAPVHFQLGNCIGRGQFGTVYRALNLNTGQTVAVKRIRLEGLKEDEVTQLMQEVDLMKSLSHPSIVKYEGMERDQDTLSIVLEYAENGSLGQTLKAFGKLNERLVANYVVKILEGLHYLHENDVVHCDLKAANILTTKTGNVKLSDFGVSLNLRAVERDQKDVAGTPNWMAPEVIELKGASPKSDIWSLGCTVVELLTGRPPYAEITNSMSVMFRIVEDTMPPLPEDCSPLLEDFLRQCFYKDPTKRPSAELLFEHAWLKKNWGLHQELRPQDSIPFLRRVSADLNKQRSDVMKLLSQGETPPSPSQPSPQSPPGRSPLGKRTSDLSMNVLGSDNDLSVREHQFVKTTFSKPMVCRVCLLNVKKSAVLCAQCSLIAHSKCTPDAPPTCDFRAQLLHYAKFAEAGSPTSQYSNPADGLPKLPVAPASDVPYISHSPRTSIDGAASPPPLPANGNSLHPPVAYKFMGAFKRSRSNLTTDTMTKGASSQEKLETTSNKRRSGTSKAGRHERPRSTTSNTTDPNSVRSAVTGGGSGSSRYERSAPSTSGKSAGSPLAEPTPTSSKLTTQSAADTIDTVDTTEYGEIDYNEAIPGSLPTDTRRHRKKDSNCAIQ